MESKTTSSFRIRPADVRNHVARAVRQRRADRANPEFRPNAEWSDIADEVHGSFQTRTYFAAVVTGLLARSLDGRADPHSLQITEGTYSYSAASVWKAFYDIASGFIDIRNLKAVPFNNSPFNGKRRVEAGWLNVHARSKDEFARTVEVLDAVATMSETGAADALRAFLWTLPDGPAAGQISGALISGRHADIHALMDEVDEFLLDDSENGRRGQAFVATCLNLVHLNRVDTPRSVNDPSRRHVGDVRLLDEEGGIVMAVEAKQKMVGPADVEEFVRASADADPLVVTGYAALINDDQFARRTGRAVLPTWESLLDRTGSVAMIWERPHELIHQALFWSGLSTDHAAARFSSSYAHFLRHVGARRTTLDNWRVRSERFGIKLEAAEDAVGAS